MSFEVTTFKYLMSYVYWVEFTCKWCGFSRCEYYWSIFVSVWFLGYFLGQCRKFVTKLTCSSEVIVEIPSSLNLSFFISFNRLILNAMLSVHLFLLKFLKALPLTELRWESADLQPAWHASTYGYRLSQGPHRVLSISSRGNSEIYISRIARYNFGRKKNKIINKK